jgi:tRNA1Val (adenine37-N6)-methyltransferase
MGSTFRFKKFEVNQRGSSMKINTDGVLLGAMAEPTGEPTNILDIGTGTGVIALMLAQRYNTALVDAVEIDAEAASCSLKNFQN